MCERARESDGRRSLPAQLPVAAKVPAVQSPGFTHVYPVEAVTSHVVPWATSVAADAQLVPPHEATAAASIVGTVQGLPAWAMESDAKDERRNREASERKGDGCAAACVNGRRDAKKEVGVERRSGGRNGIAGGWAATERRKQGAQREGGSKRTNEGIRRKMDARMGECARDSDGRRSLPAQLPVAAKVPAVQSPGFTHVYPVEAVISHVVPWATSVAADAQLVPPHEATAAVSIVGTVQALPAWAMEADTKDERRNGRVSERKGGI